MDGDGQDTKKYPPTEAPCRDCDHRHLGCHGECQPYQEYAAFREVIRTQRQEIGHARDLERDRKKRLHKTKNPHSKNGKGTWP